MCGGTAGGQRCFDQTQGLSPRVRGNLVYGMLPFQHARSIPACAGEPGTSASFAGEAVVYPRVCGGTCNGGVLQGATRGLSPRVRGNLAGLRKRNQKVRSIPACAGEPPVWVAPLRPSGVYPRVCGGTSARPRPPKSRQGLSPRVRGNRGPVSGIRAAGGSIPACAGEPAQSGTIRSSRWVYPRVCGGTLTYPAPDAAPLGLSPRVRGNPHTSSD